MAFIDRTPTKVGYKNDAGVILWCREEAGVLSQALLGEQALAGTEHELPKSVQPRYTTVRNAANKISRKLPVFSAGAPIMTPGTSINLNRIVAGVYTTTAFVSSGEWQGERQPRAGARP